MPLQIQATLATPLSQANDNPRAMAARRAAIYYQNAIPSAAYTSTQTSSTFFVGPAQTLDVFFVPTVAGGGTGVNPRIETQDPQSGAWIPVAGTAAALTGASNIGYQIGPSATKFGGMSNSSFNAYQFQLHGLCRIIVAHSDAASWTYSVNIKVSGPG